MIKSTRGSLFAQVSGRKLWRVSQPRLDMTGAVGHDREAIRRRCRAEKQDLAGRACRECVSFLISDDGRQISEAAVKNCRRDWKTHFGRSGERERGDRTEQSRRRQNHFLTTTAASLSTGTCKSMAAQITGLPFAHCIFPSTCIIPLQSQNSALSLAESADVLFMLGRRKEAGSPPPQTLPVSLPPPAKRSDR